MQAHNTEFNKTTKKALLLAFASMLGLSVLGTGFFYLNKPTPTIKVCESANEINKGIGFTFHLADDGRTIEVIEKNDTISLDFIKKNLTNGNSEEAQEILAKYKNDSRKTIDDLKEKYKNVPEFKIEVVDTDEKFQITYIFNVETEEFLKREECPELMDLFGLTYYFNTKEGAFIFDEEEFLSSKTPLGNIENVECQSKEK